MEDKAVDIIDKTELISSIISFRKDGLFQIEMKEIEKEIVLEDLREMTATIGKMGNGKVYPILVLIRRYNPMTKEASEYAASESAAIYSSASAIVINSFAVRAASNFYIQIFKPVRPTKMFNHEELAVEWLKTLRK